MMDERTLTADKGPEDLRTILGLARRFGVPELLDRPLEDLYDEPELGPEGALLVDRLSELGTLPTLGELVSDPRMVAIVAAAKPLQKRALGRALLAVLTRLKEERPADPKDVTRWAKANGVSSRLEAPLRVLDGLVDPRDRHWVYAGGTVGSILVDTGDTGKTRVPADVRGRLRTAARRYLKREAEAQHEALAEETRRLARPLPEAPAARALAERLLARRRELRATVDLGGHRDHPPRIHLETEVSWSSRRSGRTR
jgi:hypothetical protein